MRFSVALSMLPGETVQARFEAAKRLGYDGIEVSGGQNYDETMPGVAEASRATGVPVSSIVGFGGNPLSPDPAEREQALGDIGRLLAWAGRLGAVGLILVPCFGRPRMPDLSPYRTPEELARDLLLKLLPRMSEAAEKAGAFVLLEALNRYESQFLSRQEQVAEIIEAAGCPPGIALMADFFHMNIEEVDPPAALRAVAEHLKHAHLADNTRKEPGTGTLDFKANFAALKAVGFDGYGALECGIADDEPERALAETLAFLKKTYREA